jgi:NTP pyrophosphatase (non-canonical NTP hydrolase)
LGETLWAPRSGSHRPRAEAAGRQAREREEEVSDLNFRDLRNANVSRSNKWHNGTEWSALEWAGALCGEAGEAANLCKKLRRIEHGISQAKRADDALDEARLRAAIAEELADVVLYADLLAERVGADLADAIRAKFNRTSETNGFTERL